MIIKVDNEGRKMIEQLCDIALKAGGLQNAKPVSFILNSLEDHKEMKCKTDEKVVKCAKETSKK